MIKKTLGQLFQLYFDIFEKFGTHLLKESDKMIGYYVFEETASSIGFCSRRILIKFLEEGLIDEIIFEESSSLLKIFRKIESISSLRNVDSVKTSSEWKEVLQLSDKIKELLKIRWTNEELQAIFELKQTTGLSIE